MNLKKRSRGYSLLYIIDYIIIFIAFGWFALYWLPNYAREDDDNASVTVREKLKLGVDILYDGDSMYVIEKKIDTVYKME
jgi:hypothetical protein